MNNEAIKNLLMILYNNNHETIFAALAIYEAVDYKHDAMDFIKEDFEALDKAYNEYMERDDITGLINPEIMEILKGEEQCDI